MKGIQGTKGDRLLKLVHSLPVSLKKKFREYWKNRGNTSNSGQKPKSYLLIFDWIDKQSEFDLEAFKQAFPAARAKPAMYLGRVFDKVLQFMVWNTSDQEGQLREKLQQVKELLLTGGDYVSAYQINQKLIAEARSFEYPDIERAALVYHLVLMEELERYDEIAKGFTRHLRDTQVAQMKAITLDYFESTYNLYHNLMREFFVARGYVDYHILAPLLDHPQISLEKADTPKKKVYWYLLSYFIELYRGNIQQAIEAAEMVLKLFRDNPSLNNDFPFEYPKVLTRLGVSYTHLFPDRRSEVSAELFQIYQDATNQKLKAIAFRGYFITEIDYHVYQSPEKAIKIIEKFSPELFNLENLIKTEDKFVINFFVAKAYFLNGNYDSVLKWLKRIIDHPHKKIRKDLQSIARILQMFVYAETEEFSLLQSAIRSFKRWYPMENGKAMPRFEKRTLRYLNKVPYPNDEGIREYFADIQEIFQDEFENRVLRYFDFLTYIESKL